MKSKNRMRYVRYYSDVYHQGDCRYSAYRFKNPNDWLMVPRVDALINGCRICKYCGSINYYVKRDRKKLISPLYSEMQFRVIGDAFYIKSEYDCWKIVVNNDIEKLIMFRAESVPKDYSFSCPDKLKYQSWLPAGYAGGIEKFMNYIIKFDIGRKKYMSRKAG